MKRILFTIVASFCLISASAQEQNTVKTYSVYDVNHDAKVTIQDIANLVNRVKQNVSNDKQVVDADTINFLLNRMSERLKDLDDMMLLVDRLGDKVELAQAKGDAAKASAELSLTKAEMSQMVASTKVDQTEFDASIKDIYAKMAAIDEKASTGNAGLINTKVDQTEFDASIKDIYAKMAAIDEKASTGNAGLINTKVDQTEFDASIKDIYAKMAAISDLHASTTRYFEGALNEEINARKALEKEVAELKALLTK